MQVRDILNMRTGYKLAVLTILSFMPVISIHFYRAFFKGVIFPGEEAYRHLVTSKSMSHATPYHYIISLFSHTGNLEIISIIFSLVTAFLVIILFFFQVKKHLGDRTAFISSILLVLSPVFMYKVLVPNPDLLLALLILFSICLANNKTINSKAIFSLILFPIAFLIPFFGVLESIIYLTALAIFSQKKTKTLFAFFTMLFSLLGFFDTSWLYSIQQPFFVQHNILSELIAEAGGLNGLSFFSLLLAFSGVIFTWRKNKAKHKITYLAFFFLIITALFYPSINFYLNFPVSILAAIGLYTFYKKRWNLSLIKNTTLLLILYGLVFSLFLHINILSEQDPDSQLQNAIAHLEGTVLSHSSYGYWILYFSDAEPYTTSLFQSFDQKRLDISKSIFESRNLEYTKEVLENESISSIFIDKNMRHLVWTRNGQGLLFLIKNTDLMHKTFSNNRSEIWTLKKA